MSLRDEFAKAVLQGLAANPAVFARDDRCGWRLVNCTEHDLVNYAYSLADIAMDIRNPARATQPLSTMSEE